MSAPAGSGSPQPRRRGARDYAARAVALSLLGRLRNGAVIVRDGGKRHLCGKPVAGERVPEVEVLSPAVWRAAVAEGSAGLGRTWFAGQWTCADLDDLTMFLRIVIRNRDAIQRTNVFTRRIGGPIWRARLHAAEGEAEHGFFPIPASLFPLFLDETMTFSGALFKTPETTLEDAQYAKHDRICRKLGISPADHVLELGTGWGSFAVHAAGTYGCQVTTTTTAPAEFEAATHRVKEAGLADLVTVLAIDHREVTGSFDKVVSIEQLETLECREQAEFLTTCAKLLMPDGMLALQTTVVADQYYERARRSEDYVKRYASPGSCLPSIATLVEATAESTDLRLVGLDDIGSHYAETMRRWRRAYSANRDKVANSGLDETFQRFFEFYLCYREAALAERRTTAIQSYFTKPAWRPRGLHLPPA